MTCISEVTNIGRCLLHLECYEEALFYFDKVLDIDNNDKDGWYNKGFTLNQLGRYEEAIKCSDKSLEIDKNYKYGWDNKSISFIQLGRYLEGIECIDKSLDIDNNDKDSWNTKGIALFQLGIYEDAIKCFDKSLEIDYGRYSPWINKAFIYLFQHRLDDAQVCMNTALKYDKKMSYLTVRELYYFASKGQCRLFEVLDEELKKFQNKQNNISQLSIYVLAGKFFIEYCAFREAETCLQRGFKLHNNNSQLLELGKRLKEAIKTKQLAETPLHKKEMVDKPIPSFSAHCDEYPPIQDKEKEKPTHQSEPNILNSIKTGCAYS